MLPCCCLTLYENIVCSVSIYLFFSSGCYHFGNCVSHWSEWLFSMASGFVVGRNKGLIWFDFSPSERCIERIFLRTQMPSIILRGYAPNKQTDRSLQMIYVWVFVYVRPRVHISLYVSVFFKICKPHLCVCVCICPLAGRCPVQHSWSPATGGVIGTQDFPLAPWGFFSPRFQMRCL